MPRLLVHLSGEQDPRRKAKTSSRTRVLLLDAEGAEHDRPRKPEDWRSMFRLPPPPRPLLTQPRPFTGIGRCRSSEKPHIELIRSRMSASSPAAISCRSGGAPSLRRY